MLDEMITQQAELSTNHMVDTNQVARHVSLVDRQEHAMQNSAFVLNHRSGGFK